MRKERFGEIIGWYGMVVILLAYALVSFNLLSASSPVYQTLNATGALGMVYVSFQKKAYQPGVLNLIWLAIAVAAIIHLLI